MGQKIATLHPKIACGELVCMADNKTSLENTVGCIPFLDSMFSSEILKTCDQDALKM